MIYFTLFFEFFKIGLFSFGGAFGMIPLIKETVLSHGWMSEDTFFDLIGVCESTPGPIAVNMATYIGSTQAGLLGSVCATAGVVLPSFLIILLIASVMKNLTKNAWFQSVIGGVTPVVVGLILATGALLLFRSLNLTQIGEFDFVSLAVLSILTAIFLLFKFRFKKNLSAVALILLSVVLGIGVSVLFETI